MELTEKEKKLLEAVKRLVNKKIKKERKRQKKLRERMVKEVKKQVLQEVQTALSGGSGQQQQQPKSRDPLVNEVLQSQDTKESMKQAVREGAENRGGQPQQNSKQKNLQKVTETIRSQFQSGGGGQQKQQINAQQTPQPQGGQGNVPMNPAAAAAMQGGGGMPAGGMGGAQASPVSMEGGMPMAGSGELAEAEKSTKTSPQQGGRPQQQPQPQPQQRSATSGGNQMGVQQGSQENWPTVDGNQKMGGAVPGQAQGQQQVSPAQKAAAPDSVKQVANRDYSDLVNRFDD